MTFKVGSSVFMLLSFLLLPSFLSSPSLFANIQSFRWHLTEGNRLDKPVPVPSKSVHDTYQTLGVHLSPSGNTRAAVGVLLEKAKDYQTKIMSSTLPKEAALLSYTMYLLPKLGYPLPVMTLSEDICHKLQSPTLMALLP
jgi:hypothetical protein